jgi:hypothetical protein
MKVMSRSMNLLELLCIKKIVKIVNLWVCCFNKVHVQAVYVAEYIQIHVYTKT